MIVLAQLGIVLMPSYLHNTDTRQQILAYVPRQRSHHSYLNVREMHAIALTLCGDLFCSSISPSELNRNTLNARCNLIWPSAPTRWQSRFEPYPSDRSCSSTRMQFSSRAASCSCCASLVATPRRCCSTTRRSPMPQLLVMPFVSIAAAAGNRWQWRRKPPNKRRVCWTNMVCGGRVDCVCGLQCIW